jgi:hypothetical protein
MHHVTGISLERINRWIRCGGDRKSPLTLDGLKIASPGIISEAQSADRVYGREDRLEVECIEWINTIRFAGLRGNQTKGLGFFRRVIEK